MSVFDFSQYINRYRLFPWKITRIGRSASQTFAQHFVIGAVDKTMRGICRRTRAVRNLWQMRLKELVSRQLWLPNTDVRHYNDANFDSKNFELSFRRMLFCRPTYLYFRWKKARVWRPCNRPLFCPFCAARQAAQQYRYVRRQLRLLGRRNQDKTLLVRSRVYRKTIPATNFDAVLGCSDAQQHMYEHHLIGALVLQQNAVRAQARHMRKTIGYMWRITAYPVGADWVLETRQFFVYAAKKKIADVSCVGACVYDHSVALNEHFDIPGGELFHMLGEFCRYPIEFLTGNAELVAAILSASKARRLIGGAGIFRLVGVRKLMRYFKQETANGKARKEETAADRQSAN
jgi:hypothetical protein